jgi:hypothetical protein
MAFVFQFVDLIPVQRCRDAVVGQQCADPICHVGKIALMEGWNRVELLGCFEVAAAHEKDHLIGGRVQTCGDFLDRRGKVEVAFTLGTIGNRREVKPLALNAVENLHARHGLFSSERRIHYFAE